MLKKHIRFSIFRINTIQKIDVRREKKIEIISSCRVIRKFFTGLYIRSEYLIGKDRKILLKANISSKINTKYDIR